MFLYILPKKRIYSLPKFYSFKEYLLDTYKVASVRYVRIVSNTLLTYLSSLKNVIYPQGNFSTYSIYLKLSFHIFYLAWLGRGLV